MSGPPGSRQAVSWVGWETRDGVWAAATEVDEGAMAGAEGRGCARSQSDGGDCTVSDVAMRPTQRRDLWREDGGRGVIATLREGSE